MVRTGDAHDEDPDPPDAFPDPFPDPFMEELAGQLADGHPLDWEKLAHDRRMTPHGLRALRALAHLRDESKEFGPADALVSSAVARGYQVIERLGRGGYGEVYRAFHRSLQREVALKVIPKDAPASPEQRARFVREARVLASLDHPNIVRIYDIDEQEGELRLSLELIEGHTLVELVREQGPLAPAEAARIGVDLCRALAAVHGKGLVHRDIKPANAMRAVGGRIVLLDFGMTHASDLARHGDLRRAVEAGGTPLLFPPELLEKGAAPTPAGDLYSLGVTLYFLATGHYPYEADDQATLFQLLRAGKPVPLLDRRPDLPPAFANVVEQAIARDPARRYASAGALEVALRGVLAELPPDAMAAAGALKSAAPTRRLVLIAAAAVVLLIVTGITAMSLLSVGPWKQLPPLQMECELTTKRENELEQPLQNGQDVRAGDALQVTLRTDQPAWVYILNEDLLGSIHALFPDPQLGIDNPIPAHPLGERERLPPTQRWAVDDQGDGEAIIVIATRERIDWLEEAVATLPRPRKKEPVASAPVASAGGAPQSPDDFAQRFEKGMRGTGWLVADESGLERDLSISRFGRVARIVRHLETSGQVNGAIAVRVYTLNHQR